MPQSTFTFDYSQPATYHFCQDSVLLPKFVAQLESSRLTTGSRVLDLCAGCGVIGFELRHYVSQMTLLDFVEIQPEFQPHLEANRQITGASDQHIRILQMNYADLRTPSYANTYDLIISNPPYFFAGDGMLSPSAINNRCRFFIDSDLPTLIEAVFHTLRPEGRAYLLVKTGVHHGRNALRTIQTILSARGSVEVVGAIRETAIMLIKKPPLSSWRAL